MVVFDILKARNFSFESQGSQAHGSFHGANIGLCGTRLEGRLEKNQEAPFTSVLSE